jgi:hypothetical protein
MQVNVLTSNFWKKIEFMGIFNFFLLLQGGISRAKFGRTKLRLKGKIWPSIGTFVGLLMLTILALSSNWTHKNGHINIIT